VNAYLIDLTSCNVRGPTLDEKLTVVPPGHGGWVVLAMLCVGVKFCQRQLLTAVEMVLDAVTPAMPFWVEACEFTPISWC
jgi:hypothetical protein